jgi:hypothetical protein
VPEVSVGIKVGATVGATEVGGEVGTLVVGAIVGDNVGGADVGDAVGAKVGKVVGMLVVGDTVGADVGDAVAKHVDCDCRQPDTIMSAFKNNFSGACIESTTIVAPLPCLPKEIVARSASRSRRALEPPLAPRRPR